MSSSGTFPINSAPLVMRTNPSNPTSNKNTFLVDKNDVPIPANNILITSTNGILIPTTNLEINSISTTVINMNGGDISGVANINGQSYDPTQDVFWNYQPSSTVSIKNTNTGNVTISSNSTTIVPTGLIVKPNPDPSGCGLFTVSNSSESSKYVISISDSTSGGRTKDNFQLFSYENDISACLVMDINNRGTSVSLGCQDPSAPSTTLYLQGTSGLKQVYCEEYYPPPTNGSATMLTYTAIYAPQLNASLSVTTSFQQYLINSTSGNVIFTMPSYNDVSENSLVVTITCMSGIWNVSGTTLGMYMDLSSNTTVYPGANQNPSNMLIVPYTNAFGSDYFSFTISDVFTGLPPAGTPLTIHLWVKGVVGGGDFVSAPSTVTISTAVALS